MSHFLDKLSSTSVASYSPTKEYFKNLLDPHLEIFSHFNVDLTKNLIINAGYLSLQLFKDPAFLKLSPTNKEILIGLIFLTPSLSAHHSSDSFSFWENLTAHLKTHHSLIPDGFFNFDSLEIHDEENIIKAFILQHLRNKFLIDTPLSPSDINKSFKYTELLAVTYLAGFLSSELMDGLLKLEISEKTYSLIFHLWQEKILSTYSFAAAIEINLEPNPEPNLACSLLWLAKGQCQSPAIWSLLPKISPGLHPEYLDYLGPLSAYSTEDLILFLIDLSAIWNANSYWNSEEKTAFIKFFYLLTQSEPTVKASFHELERPEQYYFLSAVLGVKKIHPTLDWQDLLLNWKTENANKLFSILFQPLDFQKSATTFFEFLSLKNWLTPEWIKSLIPRATSHNYFLSNLENLMLFLSQSHAKKPDDKIIYSSLLLWKNTAEYLPPEKFLFFLKTLGQMQIEKTDFPEFREVLLKSTLSCGNSEIDFFLLNLPVFALKANPENKIIFSLLPEAKHKIWFLQTAYMLLSRAEAGEKFFSPEQTREKTRAALGMSTLNVTPPKELPFFRVLKYLAAERPGIKTWGITIPNSAATPKAGSPEMSASPPPPPSKETDEAISPRDRIPYGCLAYCL